MDFVRGEGGAGRRTAGLRDRRRPGAGRGVSFWPSLRRRGGARGRDADARPLRGAPAPAAYASARSEAILPRRRRGLHPPRPDTPTLSRGPSASRTVKPGKRERIPSSRKERAEGATEAPEPSGRRGCLSVLGVSPPLPGPGRTSLLPPPRPRGATRGRPGQAPSPKRQTEISAISETVGKRVCPLGSRGKASSGPTPFALPGGEWLGK